jgi:antitoxin component of MazEF toxin-antitoxin module
MIQIIMPGRDDRKIFRQGTSDVVAIPAAYVKYHELESGDEVSVLYDSIVVIVPKKLRSIAAKKRQLIDRLLQG